MVERYVDVYRSVLADRLTIGRADAADRQSMMASAFDQMCVTPQCGHFTELPVSTDR